MHARANRGRISAPSKKNGFFSWLALTCRNIGIVCKGLLFTACVGIPAVTTLRRMREKETAERQAYIWDIAGSVWAPKLLEMAHVRLVVSGERDYLEQGGYVVMANHTSIFDVLALATLIPKGTVVAKQEASRWPIIGPALRWSGQVIVNRSHHKEAMTAIHAHEPSKEHNILIFPEGTRTRTGELGKFKHGGTVLAVKHGMPIVPVAVLGGFEALPKGNLLRLAQNPTLEIVFGKPMHQKHGESIPDFTNRVRAHIAEVLASRRPTPQ